jgi:hypothetical protein
VKIFTIFFIEGDKTMQKNQVANQPNQITIGAGLSVEVLPNRYGERVALVISNSGGNDLYMSFGENAGNGTFGQVLAATDRFSESNSEGFKCWQGPIQVFSTAGTTVLVTERLEA